MSELFCANAKFFLIRISDELFATIGVRCDMLRYILHSHEPSKTEMNFHIHTISGYTYNAHRNALNTYEPKEQSI